MTDKKRNLFFIIGLSAITLLTFSRAFYAGYFQWDDTVFILGNPTLRLPFFEALKAAFTKVYLNDYLPITILSYWVDVHLLGNSPGIQHALNLALHIANMTLLFWFLSLLKFPRLWIWILCAVFALHPLQTEPLMWLSNRNTLLCTFFTFLACCLFQLSWQRKVGNKLFYFCGTGSYIASYFCKAAGVFLPLFLIAVDMGYHRLKFRLAVKRNSPLLAFAFLAAIHRSRLYVQGGGGRYASISFFSIDRLLRLPIAVFNALGFYIEKIFLPLDLSLMYRPFEVTSITVITAILTLLLVVLFAYSMKKTKMPEYLFFGSLLMAFLLPVLQIFPRNNYVNDRYMYIPLIGVVGLVLAFFKGKKTSKYLTKVAIIWLLALPIISYNQSKIWASDQTLWEDTVKKNPWSSLAKDKLGHDFAAEGKIGEAIAEFQSALLAEDSVTDKAYIYNNLGQAYLTQTPYFDSVKAIECFGNAVKYSILPEQTFEPRFNLAKIKLALKNKAAAVELLNSLRTDLLNQNDQRYSDLLKNVNFWLEDAQK